MVQRAQPASTNAVKQPLYGSVFVVKSKFTWVRGILQLGFIMTALIREMSGAVCGSHQDG
jgi:hypothetical protein